MSAGQTTLEEMIFGMWQKVMDSAASYEEIPTEAIQQLIDGTRSMMTEARWSGVEQHNFFAALKKALLAGTLGHPVTGQIIRLLEIETEFN